MSQIHIIACTEADMSCEFKPYPSLAMDGSCAHPSIDPADRCRMCAIEMDDEARIHREQAWLDAQVAR
jgi:hypothetical protein